LKGYKTLERRFFQRNLVSCMWLGTALFSSSVWMMIKFDLTNVHTLKGVTATNSNSSIGVYTGDGKGTNKLGIHLNDEYFQGGHSYLVANQKVYDIDSHGINS
jgi:hypothetical protein